MRILLASSEVHPYSKTGGLADMVGALGKALGRAGHEVALLTPLYAGIRERLPGLKRCTLPIDVPLGVRRVSGELWTLHPHPGLTIYFLEQPEFYQRSGLYQKDGVDYADNAERFLFLSKVTAHLALHLAKRPEIVHLHDWQAGMAGLLLAHQRRQPGWENVPPVCLTIHNLAYQGLFPSWCFPLTNLPWEYFNPEIAEFYGQLSCLKAGIASADAITTVSPRYAREITTEEYGCGLDGLLRHRQSILTGIINGVDYDEWNTVKNPYLAEAFSANDLPAKSRNKTALQAELGLPQNPEIPLFGNIGRMVEQKGVDICLGALQSALAQSELQVAVLGSGSPAYQRAFEALARRYPAKMSVKVKFDLALSHRIEAGSDFFLMPSRFEPCGLNQMYSLRYGTIPIVRTTGGLDDTVIDLREDAHLANGIKFTEYSSVALAKAIQKALALYQEPDLLAAYRKNGMAADFSWGRTAEDYVKVYQQVINGLSIDRSA
jgi:starch synthase